MASWGLGLAVGGAGVAAPHWFYVPIAVAASRFGYLGAAVTSIAAAVLAGPLLPLDVAAGVPQTPIDWGTRAGFFIALGQFLAWLIARHERAQRDLQESRRNVTVLESLLERQEAARMDNREEVQSLKDTLASGGPGIVFQPIVDLRSGHVHSVEALSRFDSDPPRDPTFWFELAWTTGLGLDLELSAVHAALREAASLPMTSYVAVNLSPEVAVSVEFRDLLASLQERRLMVEITEHAAVEEYEELRLMSHELRQHGGWLAIDDVGAGFASLRHILRLDPDVIKLDVELTRGVDGDRRRRALASGLVSFAAELGCSIVSEGIETEAELDALRSLGVRYGQGYFLCRPTKVSELSLAEPAPFSPHVLSVPIEEKQHHEHHR
jgi:EAL domain-containing protein (putative c-di-GMP-specific phosphodiesterase class I)